MSLGKAVISGVNLALGGAALSHVRQAGVGANNNRDADRLSEPEWHELTRRLETVRERFWPFCGDLEFPECMQQKKGSIDHLAGLATKHRAGNCNEQSAVVLAFLIRHRAKPLDMMYLAPYSGIDHVFVVIGRAAGSVDRKPSTWGSHAVVVDSWHDGGQVYLASELQSRMYRGPGAPSARPPLEPKSIWSSN